MKKLMVLLLSLVLCLSMLSIAFADTAEAEVETAEVEATEEVETTEEVSTGTLMVGAAIRDVTPTEENGLLPISGVGRDVYLTGVATSINVRVIAVSDGEETSLIICTETGKGPYGPQFVELYSEYTGIPVENIFYTTTHCHTAPEIKYEIDIDLDVDDESYSTLERWTKYTYLQTLDAIDEALAELQPAQMGIGYTDSYINVNRLRTFYNEDGTSYVGQGYNPDGYSDKTLAIIEFTDMDGNPIAFIMNYAMHANVMYLSAYDGESSYVNADVPGFVSTALEAEYEDCVAMWTSGAAGDQNPIITHEMYLPDLETGSSTQVIISSVVEELVTYLGSIQYVDAQECIASITEFTSDVDIGCGYAGTTIPSSTSEDGECGVQLQLVRIGDVALVGFGGELYNSFTADLQENTDIEHLLVFDNVWSHEEQNTNYFPDDDAIENGSYHDTTGYEAGYLSDALIELANQLLEESYQ